jgi:hypothetical protein
MASALGDSGGNLEYTDEQKATFKHQFAERRRRQIILAVPLVTLVVAFAVFTDERNQLALPGVPASMVAPFFFAVVVGALIFSLRNWRCPACDRYLGKGVSPRFCPKCGVALQ